ncbi:Zinc/iron permease [Radiomyces spectabilis]|uniref:Zinc/iron permease n=1 Tax=Radiomyces spectabilis TaxID=64574 RepID=UPI002220B9E7|nr:Zinc/iron permease [Radiomyces spectabilis]KAI8381560.1 Zinc/iron permease [Radiomyces spectabilis]
MSLQAKAFAFLFPGSALVNSLLATAYISIFPNLLLYFVPPDINTGSLNVLVSFAVGGLLGDVFLHLLPHAFLGEHDHGHGNEHVTVVVDNQKNVLLGLGIFGGLFFFFIMDKMMRVFNGGSGHDHGHSHGHSHGEEKEHHDVEPLAVKKSDSHEGQLRQRKFEKEGSVKSEPSASNDDKKSEKGIKLSAYLNLLADFTHNMTDGLAMAASFYASPAVGATTAVAVFFHEIPHEVGDYAILIQSGFSKKRAMMAQFTTAIGAFLGTVIGIIIEESSQLEKGAAHHSHAGILGTDLRYGDLVIPFTAGGFLYIATVGVIPELLEVTGSFVKDRRQAVTEFAAMLVGLSLMVAIAWNDVAA